MKFEDIHELMQKPEVKPDTYEAGMALNQLLKIGTHAIKIHNMIKDDQEMEAWVAKKIDLASNYVKSVHGYTAGEKAGTYDDAGMTEDADFDAEAWSNEKVEDHGLELMRLAKGQPIDIPAWDSYYDDMDDGRPLNDLDANARADDTIGGEVTGAIRDHMADIEKAGYIGDTLKFKPTADTIKYAQNIVNSPEFKKAFNSTESVSEDAGEGHMSKSQLYQTAKMSIELLDMIKKGDDLEGWVQTKLNLAADYLQAVYHYEDYQKLNPYREELDSSLMQKHAGIIQKHLDEILERKCRAEDVDTKPGMMRILKKRVNEVEKEIAKENRKETNEGPLDSIKKAFGTGARKLGAKAAGAVGMKKTAAGLQGRVDVDKKSAELDTALAQYVGQQRGDKNKIAPNILQGFLQKQGIDQKYMQYVKGPINQQQAGKLIDKIAADSFAGKVNRKQPQPQQDVAKSVAQRANQMKGVLGQQGGSAQQVAKGLGKAAQGQRMDPVQIKQLAPYAAQIQKIMADPKLAQVFRQLIMRANKKQTVTADVNEMDLDEGKIKDWAKSLAMAGVFVAGLAGVGSINDAINNSVPAIQAMNTALEMAKERGDDNLVAQIEKDLKGAKLRLDIGKDLNQVKYLQDKYEKFIQTESLTYESKLQINLNQRLK
jgi:hypothetical protein